MYSELPQKLFKLRKLLAFFGFDFNGNSKRTFTDSVDSARDMDFEEDIYDVDIIWEQVELL